MHFERLVVEAGRSAFGLTLHPGLTVISGVGPLEREGLVNDLIGALGTGRPGVHLELTAERGRRLAVFRPATGLPRVIDIERSVDVTSSFTDGQGNLNLLAGVGATPRSARRRLVVTSEDLAPRSTMEAWLLRLAHVDPHRLWDLASKVQSRAARLEEAAERSGSRVEDVEIVEELERRHQALELSEARMEKVRKASFMLAAIAIINAMSVLLLFGSVLAMAPLVVAAVVATVYSARQWQHMNEARRAEQEALDAVGATSYLTFQIARVNGLVANDRHRQDLLDAAEYHGAALAEWQVLVGDVPVDWALAHRDDVERTAATLRSQIDLTNPMATTMSPLEEAVADTAHALRHHFAQLVDSGERLPALLDEPLVDCPTEAKEQLLDLVLETSRQQQVIYLTDDPDLVRWAEARANDPGISVVTPEAIDRVGGDDAERRRHVAA